MRNLLRNILPYRWSAYYRAKREIILYSGGHIVQGPFAGMQYFTRSDDWVDCAMLLGVYERELHPILAEVMAGRCKRFIDVGHAQGYYAVGVAWKSPAVQVIG